MEKISLLDFKEQIHQHSLFSLSAGDALSPVKIKGWFDKATVSLGKSSVLYLKSGDDVCVNIRHIKEVSRTAEIGQITEYGVTCLDYSGEKPKEVTYKFECR